MFDNRLDNWAGDFAESFAGGLLAPAVRDHIPAILAHFIQSTRAIDPTFPDSVSPGTFARVLNESMPRLVLPAPARPHVPEVIARYLEYLLETGRVGEGGEWAVQVRTLALSAPKAQTLQKAPDEPKGVTYRHPAGTSQVGRNDPCPCGSGKKYKKCCLARA